MNSSRAGNRHIVGNPNARRVERVNRADSRGVVYGKDGARKLAFGDPRAHRLVAVLFKQPASADKIPVKTDFIFPQSLPVTFQPVPRNAHIRTAQMADA